MKKIRIEIKINGELLSISEFDLSLATINSFVKNTKSFLIRHLMG